MQQPKPDERVTRLEKRQSDTERTIDLHTDMLQELSRKSDMHTQGFQKIAGMLNAQQEAISEVQADVISIRATLSDHGEMHKDHGEILRQHSIRFDKLEATQAEQNQKLDRILSLLSPDKE